MNNPNPGPRQWIRAMGIGACLAAFCVNFQAAGASADEIRNTGTCDPNCPPDSGEGNCFEDNGTPGCDEEDCCCLICELDRFCCETEWDGVCAEQALASCAFRNNLFGSEPIGGGMGGVSSRVWLIDVPGGPDTALEDQPIIALSGLANVGTALIGTSGGAGSGAVHTITFDGEVIDTRKPTDSAIVAMAGAATAPPASAALGFTPGHVYATASTGLNITDALYDLGPAGVGPDVLVGLVDSITEVEGLAFHPTSGVLYGSTGAFFFGEPHLVTVSSAGEVTDVGAIRIDGLDVGGAVAGLAFARGTLYGSLGNRVGDIIAIPIDDPAGAVFDHSVTFGTGSIAGLTHRLGVAVGACCDMMFLDCRDDILEADCRGDEENWFPGEACADLVPPCEPCDINEECIDSVGCTFDSCVEGRCESLPGRYGDVAGPGGACGPDGKVSIFDLNAIVGACSGSFTPPCTPGNLDVAGIGQSCAPDGYNDILDVLAVFDAFADVNPCGGLCGPSAGASPSDSTLFGPDQRHEQPATRSIETGPVASITCEPAKSRVLPGENVTVELFVQDVSGIRAYRAMVTGRPTSGSGALDCNAILIDIFRPDSVFPPLVSGACGVACPDARVGGGLFSGSVSVGQEPAYLATVTFDVSDDATPGTTFEIEISPALDTLLFDESLEPIPFAIGPGCVVNVDAPCEVNDDCIDDDFCTFDSCVDGSCEQGSGFYGDVAGSGGSCGPDGFVDFNDVFAMFDAFASIFQPPCTRANFDIAGGEGTCGPDGQVSNADIIAVLDAFTGHGPCWEACAGGGCSNDGFCADNDVCTWDSCSGGVGGTCSHEPANYGDLVGDEGSCGPDGIVDLFDILAVLDGFSGLLRGRCTPKNMDIACDRLVGVCASGPCEPDGVVSLADILAVRDAFSNSPANFCIPLCAGEGRGSAP